MGVLKYGRRSFSVNSVIRTVEQSKILKTDINEEPAVLFNKIGSTGVATLNRPRQLNSMHYHMWKLLLPQLKSWENTQSRLIIKGAGDKAFCAGGNLKLLCSSDLEANNAYMFSFYQSLLLLSKYKIPYIALMDGVAFGSGLTLAVNARYRVATERTLVSTPESQIGWLTDSTASYLLPRLKNHLGFYLGLTGKRLRAQDVVLSGLATHFVSSGRLQELENVLCHCKVEDIEALLHAYSEPLGEFSLAPLIRSIDYCFSADTVENIIERLLEINNSWSRGLVDNFARSCPTMLKVNLRALQSGKVRNIRECLEMECRVVSRLIGSYNALEGMGAVLEQRPPRWQPASLGEVSEEMVDSYFEPVSVDKELSYYFNV